MGIYVKVRLETGQDIGWMEIKRETDLEHPHHSMPPNQPGTYEYRFRYNGGMRGVVFGSVLHDRSDDVMELIRKVLNHSEQLNPEYCGGCHCQFIQVGAHHVPECIAQSDGYEGVMVGEPGCICEDGGIPIYRKVEVPPT